MMNLSTGRTRLIDSTTIQPRLVIVGDDKSKVGTMRIDWDMELMDREALAVRGHGILASGGPTNNSAAFDLRACWGFSWGITD